MYIIVHLGGEGIYRCNAKKKDSKHDTIYREN